MLAAEVASAAIGKMHCARCSQNQCLTNNPIIKKRLQANKNGCLYWVENIDRKYMSIRPYQDYFSIA